MNSFCTDSNIPNAYIEIKDYLYTKLLPILKSKRHIIFLCIGSDRATGDSLGPLIGYKLQNINCPYFHIYGSLEHPVNALNLSSVISKLNEVYSNPFIVSIDASLGNYHNIGKIYIDYAPLAPGSALNKDLPIIGHISITGIVNVFKCSSFIVLQNTKLYTVMQLADCISDGIIYLIEELNSNFNNKNAKT